MFGARDGGDSVEQEPGFLIEGQLSLRPGSKPGVQGLHRLGRALFQAQLFRQCLRQHHSRAGSSGSLCLRVVSGPNKRLPGRDHAGPAIVQYQVSGLLLPWQLVPSGQGTTSAWRPRDGIMPRPHEGNYRLHSSRCWISRRVQRSSRPRDILCLAAAGSQAVELEQFVSSTGSGEFRRRAINP